MYVNKGENSYILVYVDKIFKRRKCDDPITGVNGEWLSVGHILCNWTFAIWLVANVFRWNSGKNHKTPKTHISNNRKKFPNYLKKFECSEI